MHLVGRGPRLVIDQWFVVLSISHSLASPKVPYPIKPRLGWATRRLFHGGRFRYSTKTTGELTEWPSPPSIEGTPLGALYRY